MFGFSRIAYYMAIIWISSDVMTSVETRHLIQAAEQGSAQRVQTRQSRVMVTPSSGRSRVGRQPLTLQNPRITPPMQADEIQTSILNEGQGVMPMPSAPPKPVFGSKNTRRAEVLDRINGIPTRLLVLNPSNPDPTPATRPVRMGRRRSEAPVRQRGVLRGRQQSDKGLREGVLSRLSGSAEPGSVFHDRMSFQFVDSGTFGNLNIPSVIKARLQRMKAPNGVPFRKNLMDRGLDMRHNPANPPSNHGIPTVLGHSIRMGPHAHVHSGHHHDHGSNSFGRFGIGKVGPSTNTRGRETHIIASNANRIHAASPRKPQSKTITAPVLESTSIKKDASKPPGSVKIAAAGTSLSTAVSKNTTQKTSSRTVVKKVKTKLIEVKGKPKQSVESAATAAASAAVAALGGSPAAAAAAAAAAKSVAAAATGSGTNISDIAGAAAKTVSGSAALSSSAVETKASKRRNLPSRSNIAVEKTPDGKTNIYLKDGSGNPIVLQASGPVKIQRIVGPDGNVQFIINPIARKPKPFTEEPPELELEEMLTTTQFLQESYGESTTAASAKVASKDVKVTETVSVSKSSKLSKTSTKSASVTSSRSKVTIKSKDINNFTTAKPDGSLISSSNSAAVSTHMIPVTVGFSTASPIHEGTLSTVGTPS